MKKLNSVIKGCFGTGDGSQTPPDKPPQKK